MFRVFITKHIPITCGISAHLPKIDSTMYRNVCPSCGSSPNTTSHIMKCTGEIITELFQAMVDDTVEWMQKNDTNPEIAMLIEDYL